MLQTVGQPMPEPPAPAADKAEKVEKR